MNFNDLQKFVEENDVIDPRIDKSLEGVLGVYFFIGLDSSSSAHLGENVISVFLAKYLNEAINRYLDCNSNKGLEDVEEMNVFVRKVENLQRPILTLSYEEPY